MSAPSPVYAAPGNQPDSVAHENIRPSCLDITINSLAFKILSCIPLVGTFSTLFSLIYLYNKFDPNLNIEEKLEIRKNQRDYYCASTVRNVVEFALISLGILSTTPVPCVILAVFWAYDWIRADLLIQNVEKQLENAQPV